MKRITNKNSKQFVTSIEKLFTTKMITKTTLKSCITLILFFVAFSSNSFGQSQIIDPNFQASLEKIGGHIRTSTTQPDGKILIGGYFRFIDGGKRINIARLNLDRSLDTTFNPGSGGDKDITSIAVQSDGKILVGGYFTKFDDVNAGGIVRLNSDGSVDSSFDSTGIDTAENSAKGVFSIIPLASGKILLGGDFSTYQGISVKNIVRINSNGTLDSSFSPSNSIIIGRVVTMQLSSNGKVYVGINFRKQSAYMSRLIRLNNDGSEDTGFASTMHGGNIITSLIQPDGKVLVTGSILIEKVTLSLYRYNIDGTLDKGFGANSNSAITSIILEPDGKITVAGEFETLNGQSQNRFARLNSDGSTDTSFATDTQLNFSVRTAIKLSDGKFLLGGLYTQNEDPVNPLALQETNGNKDNNFVTKVKINSNSEVMAIQPDGKILIAGPFGFVNGKSRDGFARLNVDGSLDESFNVSIDNSIETIAVQNDGKILLGGKFENVNNTSQENIARLNADGTIDSTFDSGTGVGGPFFPDPYVSKITILDSGQIMIGGTFGTYNDFAHKGIARLNSDGSIDDTFDAAGGITGGSEIVHDIVPQPDGKLLVGGDFVFIDGQRRSDLIRLNADGSRDKSFQDVGLSNSVFTIALQPNGKIIIGGIFDSINGVEYKHIVRLNSDGSVDNTFNLGAGFSGGHGFAYVKEILLLTDGKVLVGGNFTFYNGIASNFLELLNPDGSMDTSFNVGTGANGPINSLILQSNEKLLLGGLFSEIDGEFQSAISRILFNQTLAPYDFDGDGKSDVSIFRYNTAPAQWWILRSSDFSNYAFTFGWGSDTPVPADFTGDGKTDVAYWREATGEWFVLRSEDNSFFSFPFGTAGDIPVPGDFDGDGKADPAVYRPSDGTWYILNSSGGTTITPFGISEDKPVVADYDGDGMDDIAIYRPSVSQWWLNRSTDGVQVYQFGTTGDKTVQGDYTGDGKADVAFWRPSNGEWYVIRSEDNSFYSYPFGTATDIPIPGDYDGDGKQDAAVFRPSTTTWYLQGETSGTQIVTFGFNDDIPLANSFVTE